MREHVRNGSSAFIVARTLSGLGTLTQTLFCPAIPQSIVRNLFGQLILLLRIHLMPTFHVWSLTIHFATVGSSTLVLEKYDSILKFI